MSSQESQDGDSMICACQIKRPREAAAMDYSEEESDDYSDKQSDNHSEVESDNDSKEQSKESLKKKLNVAVNNVMIYLLREMRNNNMTLKKDDVVTNALNKSDEQYSMIMSRVNTYINNIFGQQLIKVPCSNEDAFIIAKTPIRFKPHTLLHSQVMFKVIENMSLFAALSSILMNKGNMCENMLMEAVCYSIRPYHWFSEEEMTEHLNTLIKDVFVKQMYLHVTEVFVRNNEEPLPESSSSNINSKQTVYQWGYRAYIEVDVEDVVDFLKKLNGGHKPPHFPFGYYKETKCVQNMRRMQARNSFDKDEVQYFNMS